MLSYHLGAKSRASLDSSMSPHNMHMTFVERKTLSLCEKFACHSRKKIIIIVHPENKLYREVA